MARGVIDVAPTRDGGWTRDLVMSRLNRIYRAACLDRKWPSAIRCVELAGYELGMLTKRVELDVYSDDQLKRVAEAMGLTPEAIREAAAFVDSVLD